MCVLEKGRIEKYPIAPLYINIFIMTVKRGKKYKKALELLNKNMAYSIDEAVELLEKTNTVKFDPTVEVHFNLNAMIRSTISLPHGIGKTVKICVFSEQGNASDLLSIGASKVGGEELVEQISKWEVALDFDVCIATPTMMRQMWKIARILGPKWIMPNPKTGTVWEDLVSIVKEFSAGRFEFKTDKQNNLHSVFWKLSFGKEKMTENLSKFIETVKEMKPAGTKGKFINTIYVCNAMGPSIKLNISG